MEGWHRFFKACIAKHVHGGGVEWDKLVPLAVSAYNFFPCQSSKESPFILMFGRDPITPVAKLLEPRLRYYGERGSALKMDKLRRLYTIVVENIRKAREKLPKKEDEPHNFKVNDMVLVKDPDAAVFEPRYQPNFVQDKQGHKSIRRSAHVKYIAPSEKVVKQLPGEQVLKNYGRSSKLLLAEKDIPDLHFNVTETEEKGEPSDRADVMEIMNMDIKESTQNSDSQEHSKNSLKSVAGGALHRKSEHGNVEKTIGVKLFEETSECRELSQESRSSEHLEEMPRKLVKQTFSRDTHLQHSENREHSQNSQKKEAREDTQNIKVTVSAEGTKHSAVSSDFLEDSQNSLSSSEREAKEGEANMSTGDRDGQ